jgi:hypothetical protein
MNMLQNIFDAIRLKMAESDVSFVTKRFNALPSDDFRLEICSAMQKNYHLLRERYAYRLQDKLHITEDWSKYLRAVGKLKASNDPKENERLSMIATEIEKRYIALIPEEYETPPKFEDYIFLE